MVLFAKTRWLQEVVGSNHGLYVHKVLASVDHAVYYPDLSYKRSDSAKLVVAAMIRPSTARRAPYRTIRIMNCLYRKYGERVEGITFGCHDAELERLGTRLERTRHLGVLGRREVGDLMRHVDLFLDLSDFQAFGRTAIEAMSCGAVALVPAHGGAYEFGVHGVNCFVVDTRLDDRVIDAIDSYVRMEASQRRRMRLAAISTGYRYAPELAALSELSLFSSVALGWGDR